jgi:hypothetical protein
MIPPTKTPDGKPLLPATGASVFGLVAPDVVTIVSGDAVTEVEGGFVVCVDGSTLTGADEVPVDAAVLITVGSLVTEDEVLFGVWPKLNDMMANTMRDGRTFMFND